MHRAHSALIGKRSGSRARALGAFPWGSLLLAAGFLKAGRAAAAAACLASELRLVDVPPISGWLAVLCVCVF